MSRIAKAFADLRQRKRIALMPFIPAGYPNLDATKALIPALAAAGASMIEVGIPFSDPIADGPVIQEAFAAALANHVTVADILAAIAAVRPLVDIPLVAMVSYSIAYRHGIDRFIAECKQAGFDGLILPDLPPPEATDISRKIQAAGLDTVLLIAPTTSRERSKEIADLASGFIYYLSVSGITGERNSLPADLRQKLTDLRQLTDRPLCVGFGISTANHVAQLAPVADGAIVGSALVRRISQYSDKSTAEIAAQAADFCRSLLPA
jgi:tryptophan synthase alpha chain